MGLEASVFQERLCRSVRAEMPDRSHFQETGVVNISNAKVSIFQNADNQLKFIFSASKQAKDGPGIMSTGWMGLCHQLH